jgi:hypothetical protein
LFLIVRQRHVQVIVQSLGALVDQDLDQETIDEAAHALTNLAKKSLEHLQIEKYKSIQSVQSTTGRSDDSLPSFSPGKSLTWEEFISSDYGMSSLTSLTHSHIHIHIDTQLMFVVFFQID